jgi:hypothetical protein
MFFPCTSNETVLIDGMPSPCSKPKEAMDDINASESSSSGKIPEYLTKPTIIMCNPNALVY